MTPVVPKLTVFDILKTKKDFDLKVWVWEAKLSQLTLSKVGKTGGVRGNGHGAHKA